MCNRNFERIPFRRTLYEAVTLKPRKPVISRYNLDDLKEYLKGMAEDEVVYILTKEPFDTIRNRLSAFVNNKFGKGKFGVAEDSEGRPVIYHIKTRRQKEKERRGLRS